MAKNDHDADDRSASGSSKNMGGGKHMGGTAAKKEPPDIKPPTKGGKGGK